MTLTATYAETRGRLAHYFDRTAADAWAKLTSDAPVSGVRATVRAGRTRMRDILLGGLPEDLSGQTLLDAGCGAGALAVAAARRGARVTAIDLSPTMIGLARDRAPDDFAVGSVDFRVGDMMAEDLGAFDHVVAMDSLIHYRAKDIEAAVSAAAARTRRSIQFTFAPRTAALSAMHTVGKLFPRGDRSPAIRPIGEADLRRRLSRLTDWRVTASERVSSGFYTSHALRLERG